MSCDTKIKELKGTPIQIYAVKPSLNHINSVCVGQSSGGRLVANSFSYDLIGKNCTMCKCVYLDFKFYIPEQISVAMAIHSVYP